MARYEFPASFSQRQMWLLAQLDPDQPTYNIAWALWLEGELDLGTLQRAWGAALTRHEALRTTFRDSAGLPVQVIEDDPAKRPIEVSSVQSLPAGQREPAALALIGQLARIRIDLATGPLVRARLVRLTPQRHVLAVVMHHIVADGWSFRILFDELSADYAAIRGGGEPGADEPPIQYADFAIWQLEHAGEGGYGPAERFWRAELTGAPSALPLPADKPRPPRQMFTAASVSAVIDTGLAAALREVAARQDATVFAVLLAAYAVVLGRLTGTDDLLIAVPMAARTRPETESVVGLFVNTVPVRVRLDGGQTLGDLVRSVHAAAGRALAQQELPFGRMVELIRPDRDPARLPLVQVMFAMEEPWQAPDRGGLRWHPELVQNGTAKFEIELTVTGAPDRTEGPGQRESQDGQQVRVSYNRDLFHPATGELVADGFGRILRCLADHSGRPVAEADIMSPAELELVTRVWPDGGPTAGQHATAVAQLWQACSGDTVLALGQDGALTGSHARELASRIAAALRRHGVRAADQVAILLPRGARLLPAILGTWLAGAAYVPLDPIYPEQRLAAMLADAGVRAIIVHSGTAGAPVPPPAATPIPVLDLAAPDLAEPAQAAAGHAQAAAGHAQLAGACLPPSAPAYTIFTSGSTGRPKPVSVTQGGLGTLLDAVRPMLALGPRDRLLAATTFAFDIAVVELLAPVLAGGCVVITDAEQSLDAVQLRGLLASRGATAFQATPAGWRMLIEAGPIPAGVTLRMAAGEPLPRDLADAIGGGPGVRLWNLYGPTETTVYSGGALVSPPPAPIEIGPVIAGTQLYLLDGWLRPVPPGVLGELYIGGAGLAQGYPGAAGLTGRRFVPDPFGSQPGARLYRTGDLGRWRRPGCIELAGRADRQFKIRGYRVESGEVEEALRSQPGITEAVVSLRGSGHDVRLVAYLVTRSGAGQPPEGLRERLAEALPGYMVPAAFVVLPRLPLTTSGKIDYRALPEPDWSGQAGQAAIAPRTPVEAALAAIVAELLSLPGPVGVTDNFFALGGHSLTATQLVARIQAAYGIDLPVRALFSDPTVAGLAAALVPAARGRS